MGMSSLFWVSLINSLPSFFPFSFFYTAIWIRLREGELGQGEKRLGNFNVDMSLFLHTFIRGDTILKTFSGMYLFLWDLYLHLWALSCFTHIPKDLYHLKCWDSDPSRMVLPFCPQISQTLHPQPDIASTCSEGQQGPRPHLSCALEEENC